MNETGFSIAVPIKENPPMIELSNPHGDSVGKLENKDGVLSFTGNVDESARIFFDQCISLNNQELQRLRAENAELKARL